MSGKSKYEVNRLRQVAYGRWQPYVDARPARDHLAVLSAAGIGWKRAAVLAGLSPGTVSNVLHGAPGRPPAQQVRPQTLAKILAVTPRLQDMAPGALVDATGTRRRLQGLAAPPDSWPLTRVAARLGWPRSMAGLVMRRGQVTAATALAVRAICEELQYRPCPAANAYERAGIRRAAAHASRQRWAPLAAWDDIDDPRARPRGVRRDEAA